jgi:hypothetical protein
MARIERLTVQAVQLASVAVIGIGLSACGGGNDPEDEVRAAIQDLHADLAKGRDLRVCEALLPPAQAEIALAAHGKQSVCRADLRELRTRLRTTSIKLPTTPRPEILDVSVRGARAKVALSARGVTPWRISLVDREGWKLVRAFGATRPGFVTLPAGAVDHTPAGEPSCKFDAAGKPSRRPCAASASGWLGMKVRSAFGAFDLGRCESDFSLRFGRGNRTRIDGLHLVCTDITPCKRYMQRPLPGRLTHTAQGIRIQTHFCVNSCVGAYEGDVTLRLKKVRGARKLRAVSAPVGDGGLELNSTWNLGARRSTTRPE